MSLKTVPLLLRWLVLIWAAKHRPRRLVEGALWRFLPYTVRVYGALNIISCRSRSCLSFTATIARSGMRGVRAHFIHYAAVCCCSFVGLPPLAAQVDMEQAQRGERLQLRDVQLSRDRDRLFANELYMPVPQLVYRIAEAHDGMGLTVLASRLLRPPPRAVEVANRQHDELLKLAILRELRFRSEPSLVPVLAQVLTQEDALPVVQMVLMDGIRLDAEAFVGHALRLVVSTARDAHPGAQQLRTRRFALQVLVGHYGLRHEATIRALRHAIGNGHPLLCLTALELLPLGEQPSLSAVALTRVLPEIAEGQRGLPWSIALAALRRCQLPADHPLVEDLMQLIEGGDRDVAHALLLAIRHRRVLISADHRRQLVAMAARQQDETVWLVLSDLVGASALPESSEVIGPALQHLEVVRGRVRAAQTMGDRADRREGQANEKGTEGEEATETRAP